MVAGEQSSYYRVECPRLASSYSILTLKLTLTILIYCLQTPLPAPVRSLRAAHPVIHASPRLPNQALQQAENVCTGGLPPSYIPAAGLSIHGPALETRILNRTRDGSTIMIISLRPSLAERRKRMSASLACSICVHGRLRRPPARQRRRRG